VSVTSHIVIVGAGAVGGYIAGHLAAQGVRVSVLEDWSEHADVIRREGLTICEPSRKIVGRPAVIDHLSQLPELRPTLVALCCKIPHLETWVRRIRNVGSYDGPWLATLNGLADLALGRMVGPNNVIGCIVTGLFAELERPGHVRRSRDPRPAGPALFRVGELAHPTGARVSEIADLLRLIDAAEEVQDLLKARWTKLVFNAMTSPLGAVSGQPTRILFLDPTLRLEMLAIAYEVVRVAQAAGQSIDPVCGVPGTTWQSAAAGDGSADASVTEALVRYGSTIDPGARSGMAQDLSRGRGTEVDAINGAVAEEAARFGIEAPANLAIIDRLHRMAITSTG